MANCTAFLLILAISAVAVQGKPRPSYSSNSNSNSLGRRDTTKDPNAVDFRNMGSSSPAYRDSEDPTTPATDAARTRNKPTAEPSLAIFRHRQARLAGKAARAIVNALTDDLGETAAAAIATAVHRVVEAAENGTGRRNYNVNSNSNFLGGPKPVDNFERGRRSRKQSQRDDAPTTEPSEPAREFEYPELGDFALPDIPELPDFPNRPDLDIPDAPSPESEELQMDENWEDGEVDPRGHGNVNLNSNTNHFLPRTRRYGRSGQPGTRRGAYNINTNSNNYRRRALYDEEDDPEKDNPPIVPMPSKSRGKKTAPLGSYNSNSNTNTFRRATYNSNANSNSFSRRWHG